MFLPFALPDIDDAELDEVADSLRSGWLTTGLKTHSFEERFRTYVGAGHSVAVNSCTAAMHLALATLGLEAGDEVITSTYTFAATAEVVRYFGAHPVLVDVDRDTLNLDVDALEAAITPRTRATMPVHYAGQPADLQAVYRLATEHGLAVVEDAAHALPARDGDRMIGADLTEATFPHFTCFSFYATKTLTTGEGGMICTPSREAADACRVKALHGISHDAWNRYTAAGSWYYEIVEPGFKYNMTDVAASLGLRQLDKVETMWQRRRHIAALYDEAFSENQALEIPTVRPDVQHAWHLYPLRLHLGKLSIDRASFIEELKRRNIGASVHFIPLHLHPYYRETYGYRPEDFPVALTQFEREVSLPIYSKMSEEDAQDVIEAVLAIAEGHRAS